MKKGDFVRITIDDDIVEGILLSRGICICIALEGAIRDEFETWNILVGNVIKVAIISVDTEVKVISRVDDCEG